MKPIELFGTGVMSYSAVVTKQRRLNCFYDIRKDGEKAQFSVRGTPGSQIWITLPTSPIRGWVISDNILYIVAGRVLYGVTTAGVATNLGTITSSTGNVGIATSGLEVTIVDGTAGYVLTIAGSAFATIVDANFPAGATTVMFLNGRFIVEKPNTRQAYASASYAGATWTPAIFWTKENYPDDLIAVEPLNGNIVMYGADSIEFWQDVGGQQLPYQRVNGATQPWGLAALWSRAPIGVTEIFLAKNKQGNVQVMKFNGYTPDRISTSDVENIINNFSTFSDAVALTYMVDGHTMYQLTFPTGGRTFLYDNLTDVWQEAQTGLALTARHFGNLGIAFNAVNYMSDASTGVIYSFNQSVYTDNGVAIKRQVISKHIRNGGNEFGISEIFLDMETGVGLQSGQGSDPMITMNVSKDGGRTFGADRVTSMGKIGQYQTPRVRWNRMGSAKDFVFCFTMTDPVKFIIASTGVELAE